MALVIIVDNIKINWANLYLKWFSNSWSCFSDFSLVCLLLRLLTSFPWLVSTQTLNETAHELPQAGQHADPQQARGTQLRSSRSARPRPRRDPRAYPCGRVRQVQRYPQWESDILTMVESKRLAGRQTPQSWPAPCWTCSRTRSLTCPSPSYQGSSPWRPPPCAPARGSSVQVGLLFWSHFLSKLISTRFG